MEELNKNNIEAKLIDLFINTVVHIPDTESASTNEQLDIFLASFIKQDKSKTQVQIQVPEKGMIPNIISSTNADIPTIVNDTDRKLRDMFRNTETPPTKEYVATINIDKEK